MIISNLDAENTELKKLELCLDSIDSKTEVYKITKVAVQDCRAYIMKLNELSKSFSIRINIAPNNCITINNLFGHTMLQVLWKQIKVSLVNYYTLI